jgi:PAS domain S-box-containing protein
VSKRSTIDRKKQVGEELERKRALRNKAEDVLREMPKGKKMRTPGEVQSLIHEFEVHQIELEMQNEELRQAQEALLESRDRYTDLYDYAPVGYITINDKGLVLETNMTVIDMLGIERRQMINKPFSLFIFKDDQDIYYKHRQKLLDNNKKSTCDVRMMKTGGQQLWAKLNSVPIKRVDVPSLQIAITDITERKLAEKELRRAQINYRMIADYTYDWEWWTNVDGTFRYVSPACERITGYRADLFIENNSLLKEIIVHEDREKWDKHDNESNKDVGLREMQFCIKRSDGEVRWIEHACQPVFTGENEFLGFRASNRDITARKRAEKERDKTDAELRILSAQLLSAQERERKRIARDIHDSIGQALAAIKFSVENSLSAFDEKSIPSAIELLENIIPLTQNSIEEVRRIIMDLRPSTLDDLGLMPTISWFCREFESIYTTILVEKEIHVEEADISPSLKTVIYRIMQEALNNAAKHGQTAVIHFHLVKNKDNLELMVEDTGIGFNPDELQSGEMERKGMGLGSMKERAQNSGGSFTLQSCPGIGTKILVSWPIKASSVDQG